MVKRQPPPSITTQDWDATPNSVQTLVYTLLAAVEEMQQIVSVLQKQIEQQQKVIKQQQKQINQLEEQVGKTSRNSSKPPSSDPPHVKKAPPKAKGKRKQGGQPGHKGHGRKLKPPEEVTRFVVSKPSECEECGTLLLGIDPQPHRHQVCELPPIEPEIIEYQAHALTCLCCGHKNRAPWPAAMPTGSFGPRVQGLIGYLSGRFSVSRRDVEEMMASIFQVEISLGAVSTQEANLSDALEQPVTEAQNYVQQQAQANTDETSWKKNNKQHWLWTATTEWVTIFLVVATRGADGFKQLMGTEFSGIIGSDRWSAYNGLSAARRQLCWAHLLRDFQAFVDRKGESAVIGQALLKQATAMFDLWHRARDGTLSRPDFQKAMRPIRQEVEALLAVGTFVNHSKTVNTCANILKIAPALWSFVEHEGIEPTNNAAERALRRGVLWRKRSFGSQSDRGLRFTERILTTVTTLRQQQRNVLDFLALACHAQHLGLPAPSLLPVNSDVDPVFTN
jgi:transposase